MGSLVLAGATSGSTTITPTDAVTATVTLPSTGGTLQTSGAGFTTNGVAYATSTSALTTGSALTFNGTNFGVGTSSPSSKLEVATSTAGYAAIFTNTNGASDSNGLYIKSGTVSTEYNLRLSNTSGSTDFMVVKGNGNVGIGTSSPAYKLQVSGAQNANDIVSTNITTSASLRMQMIDGYGSIFTTASYPFTFGTNNTEGMRLATDGRLLVGATSNTTNGGLSLDPNYNGTGISNLTIGHPSAGATNHQYMIFTYNANIIGSIVQSGTTAVAYNTSSDYRLKNTIAPMTGALSKVAQLKPVTYKWNADGSDAEGFIAHELAEVCPHAVSGTKDEVDADGNPKYQGIDTSFLVATLTSAIQELSALVTAQSATITSLTERITALEGK
jgi:hypothetical protein